MGIYHRLIKGTNNLKVKVIKLKKWFFFLIYTL
jgi:hypothetical protein